MSQPHVAHWSAIPLSPRHSAAYRWRNSAHYCIKLNTVLGKVNGYIIEYNDGHLVYRIYWTGDDVWFDGMQDLTKYGKIDLLIPDMGAVGSDGKIGRRGLNSGDCLMIITLLDPGAVIPVHHTTFSMYVEPVLTLRDTLDTTVYKNRLKLPQPGSILEL